MEVIFPNVIITFSKGIHSYKKIFYFPWTKQTPENWENILCKTNGVFAAAVIDGGGALVWNIFVYYFVSSNGKGVVEEDCEQFWARKKGRRIGNSVAMRMPQERSFVFVYRNAEV